MSARDDLLDEYGRADTAPLGSLADLRQKLDAIHAEVLCKAAGLLEGHARQQFREATRAYAEWHAAAAELRRMAAEAGKVAPDGGEITQPADTTPLVVRWDRTVIPDETGDDTIVCCLAEDGRPVALVLDDEHREALGAQLLDPDGDGETGELTVYRAAYEHEQIPLGTYTNEAAARAHCKARARFDQPDDVEVTFDWIGDEDDPEEPWELVAEFGGQEQPTGYLVIPVAVASEYDEEADE